MNSENPEYSPSPLGTKPILELRTAGFASEQSMEAFHKYVGKLQAGSAFSHLLASVEKMREAATIAAQRLGKLSFSSPSEDDTLKRMWSEAPDNVPLIRSQLAPIQMPELAAISNLRALGFDFGLGIDGDVESIYDSSGNLIYNPCSPQPKLGDFSKLVSFPIKPPTLEWQLTHIVDRVYRSSKKESMNLASAVDSLVRK